MLKSCLYHKSNGSNSTQPVAIKKVRKLEPCGGGKASDTAETEYHHVSICRIGGRTGESPTGFLVKFVDGFSSPPHIHNVTRRAAVLDGLVHNDDPDAAPMWMPVGSFLTQPAGEVHITSAKGDVNIALVEIDTSPYRLCHPSRLSIAVNDRSMLTRETLSG